jgi:metal-sulfur cluster biosynthetic enzyme
VTHRDATETADSKDTPGAALNNKVRDALRRVQDPEVGRNIVELGLVRNIVVSDSGEVDVTITLTSVGCPAADYLTQTIMWACGAVPGVTSTAVHLTFHPPWTLADVDPQVIEEMRATGLIS